MKPIHPRRTPFLLFLLVILAWAPSLRAEAPLPDAASLLKKIETRAGADGFSARFYQESPLQAIGIVETAEGKVWFRKPDRIRWEYETPDRLHYVTDGETLWIHSLDDGQVWTGSATDFFGSGGGARFLADITTVTERFNPGAPESIHGTYRLVLTPKNPEDALAQVVLSVDPASFDILRVASTSKTGEETTLSFSKFVRKKPALTRFIFQIPEGAVVSPLE
ncbi:outer membrane lipoprotein carrier protein LolA [Desulfoluna sp.]|uniref:LolA family protein n=1 Tax=Desulfoluna sp. TaxID=2045199 RepID=UPI00260C725F|nr:outer membrane lipoprotein carrier protein LolA [Desulfoluna sp.]